ncbi:MAG: hypothetical protein A4S12_10705 [Proteobacteria bacterium SG_bin5]|nr:hypothetical protein [Sphingomonas sp.]OQW39961.1 MAG: hypothetical protein A4S12_10705 [Proteobacteria bacterium SG_bin5]
MQAGLWVLVATFAALGLLGYQRDRARRHRRDPDRVGVIDWALVQLLAVLGALVCAALALGAGQ